MAKYMSGLNYMSGLKIVFGVLFFATSTDHAAADPNPFLEDSAVYPGPYRAVVERIIDADTISVSINLWPGSIQLANIRVRNIDAPEIRTSCEAEKMLGFEAKKWVEGVYPEGEVVRLDDIEADPFSGRFVADIRRWRSDRWLYLAEELIERDYAQVWNPSMPDIDWCKIAENNEKGAD